VVLKLIHGHHPYDAEIFKTTIPDENGSYRVIKELKK
jgi:hypothetical protein